ncbi:MAG: hypothetical protein WDZ31_01590 [Phycisphaeraceae bacterium]
MGHLVSGLAGVDPHAWMVTLPVVVALVVAAAQPAEGRLKRWWAELLRAEAMAWAQVTGREAAAPRWPAWRQGLLCSATTALTLGTLLSMASYVGLMG